MSHRLYVGFFGDEHSLMGAAKECHERGIPIDDIISPYPLHGVDGLLGIRPSRLPWVTLLGGTLGVSLGFGFQYWSSATNWPIDVGGKPFNSLPAFMPVAFELTVLGAGLITVLALLLRCGLLPGRQARVGFEKTTDNEFALILAQRDATFPDEDFTDVLERHHAARTQLMMTEDPA